jgi:Prophage minor tail protein Z (GPZ)
MSSCTVRLNTADVERAINVLRAKAPIAIVRALNKSIDSAKVAMAREVATDMGLKVGDTKNRIGVTPARLDKFSATLHAHGTPIPLIEFSATGPEPSRGKGRGVSAKLSAKRTRYPHSFIATMRSGHRGVFTRAEGAKRLKILEQHGPSIAYVFAKHVAVGIARGEEQLVKNLQSEFRFATGQTGKTA